MGSKVEQVIARPRVGALPMERWRVGMTMSGDGKNMLI
jgi:hypothetical protein